MTEEVLFHISENGAGTITLNRPEAINSLTHGMLAVIREKLLSWKNDDNIKVIILEGAGSRGLCAGGDMKALYQAKDQEGSLEDAKTFFEVEYETDLLIYHYPKPIIASLDGIVMGGGVGLSYGASHRIVTETTKWSMPEMNIGFFPDVGAAYFLNKAPGYTGRYLALNAEVISAADVLYIHGADHYMPQDQLTMFLEEIKGANWHEANPEEDMAKLVKSYTENAEVQKGHLAEAQDMINQHFKHETVEEIIASLETDPSDFAQKTRHNLLSKSPVSLKVTLEQLKRGAGKTFADCLETDLTLAKRFMEHHDFYEGVRSVLIDKDRHPNYRYKHLLDVTDDLVESFFMRDSG